MIIIYKKNCMRTKRDDNNCLTFEQQYLYNRKMSWRGAVVPKNNIQIFFVVDTVWYGDSVYKYKKLEKKGKTKKIKTCNVNMHIQYNNKYGNK